MKIHYLITSLENGGTQFVLPRIVQTFHKFGHEVTVTACEPRDMLGAERLDAAHIPYDVMFPERRSKVANIAAFTRRLRQSRPDVIWTSLSAATLVGSVAGAILRIPVVSWKHSATIRRYTALTKNLTRLWVADSQGVARYLHDTVGVSNDRIMSWPLHCCTDSVLESPGWSGDGILRVGSVGRLGAQKNYAVLFDALARFRAVRPDLAARIHISIAGEGPQRQMLTEQVARLKLGTQVTFEGLLPSTEPFYRTLDLYVQPSLYEGMCLAAHEAMAIGLPVAATPVGELATSIRTDETGFVLRGDLSEALCEVFETVFRDPSVLSRMGAAGAAYVRQAYGPDAFDEAGRRILERIETML